MQSIIAGSIVLSLLHAVIPNHWLPIIAIGRKEGWSLDEITRVTMLAALAHALSTILIGIILGLLGIELKEHIASFTRVIAPSILIILGFIFIYRHHRHKHFKIEGDPAKKSSKAKIITALVVAMFFSPCMEIEAYFLMAGTISKWLIALLSFLYTFITTTGMILFIRFAYKGILKFNWHSLEHNAGIIAGFTLVLTGLVSFFIQ